MSVYKNPKGGPHILTPLGTRSKKLELLASLQAKNRIFQSFEVWIRIYLVYDFNSYREAMFKGWDIYGTPHFHKKLGQKSSILSF